MNKKKKKKKNPSQKYGGVTQGEGHEFKLQYHKKKERTILASNMLEHLQCQAMN
jgi:hypothetical protein